MLILNNSDVSMIFLDFWMVFIDFGMVCSDFLMTFTGFLMVFSDFSMVFIDFLIFTDLSMVFINFSMVFTDVSMVFIDFQNFEPCFPCIWFARLFDGSFKFSFALYDFPCNFLHFDVFSNVDQRRGPVSVVFSFSSCLLAFQRFSCICI